MYLTVTLDNRTSIFIESLIVWRHHITAGKFASAMPRNVNSRGTMLSGAGMEMTLSEC